MQDCNCDNKVKTRKKRIYYEYHMRLYPVRFALLLIKFFVNFCFSELLREANTHSQTWQKLLEACAIHISFLWQCLFNFNVPI